MEAAVIEDLIFRRLKCKNEEVLYFGKNQCFINCFKNQCSPVIAQTRALNLLLHLNNHLFY